MKNSANLPDVVSKKFYLALNSYEIKKERKKAGEAMVELDQFKSILNSYTKPLVEVRDSL